MANGHATVFTNPPVIVGDGPADGYTVVWDAASGTWKAVAPSGTSVRVVYVSDDYTAVAGDTVICDANGPFTVTLPDPVEGDQITVMVTDNAAGHVVTVVGITNVAGEEADLILRGDQPSVTVIGAISPAIPGLAWFTIPAPVANQCALYQGNDTVCPAGVRTSLTFDNLADGADLLDISAPDAPFFKTQGTYCLAVNVEADEDLTVGAVYNASIVFDVGAQTFSPDFTSPNATAGQRAPGIFFSVTAFFPLALSGHGFQVKVTNHDSVDHPFIIGNALIQRIS